MRQDRHRTEQKRTIMRCYEREQCVSDRWDGVMVVVLRCVHVTLRLSDVQGEWVSTRSTSNLWRPTPSYFEIQKPTPDSPTIPLHMMLPSYHQVLPPSNRCCISKNLLVVSGWAASTRSSKTKPRELSSRARARLNTL